MARQDHSNSRLRPDTAPKTPDTSKADDQDQEQTDDTDDRTAQEPPVITDYASL
jgi:hypothetical protein